MAAALPHEFRGTKRFEVVRRLGEGSMGVVYEVLDLERGTRAALKTMRAMGAEGILAFKNEFRALQDIQHPNLVSLGELLVEGSVWCFTMELIEGIDFLTRVRGPETVKRDVVTVRDSPIAIPVRQSDAPRVALVVDDLERSDPAFDEGQLRHALAQLVQGLDALHGAGKVHRDVKPSNVLVTDEGRVVVLDFGLVTDVATHDHSGDADLAGTVEYMSPEQAASEPLGPESDWYGVGVLLYEALTGRLPFTGTAYEVMLDKQRYEPPPPRALVRDLPPYLDHLCEELLRFDPGSRPNAREILRRIRVVPPRTSLIVPSLPSLGPPASFVGRDDEVAALNAAFDRVRSGKALTMLVQGESGVGKSALVRHFTGALTAASADTLILAGRCYERESVPFKAFDGIVDALSKTLRGLNKHEAEAMVPDDVGVVADVFPVLRRAEVVVTRSRRTRPVLDAHSQRSRFFAAVRTLFTRLAEWRPTVLVIDDLQWADHDSFTLLESMLSPPDPPKLVLLATVRTGSDIAADSRELLSRLPGEVRKIELTGLRHDEALLLAGHLLSGAGADFLPHVEGEAARFADAIVTEASGHPLFIDALVRHAMARGAHEPGALRLDEALWDRITSLELPARRLVQVVAVAGAPLPQEVAAHAAELDSAQFTRTASLLRVAHLLRTTGVRGEGAIEPYHDRVRAAVMQHLDAEEKRACHARVAVALELSGRADPEALAMHFLDAGQAERAAEYAADAAARAAASFAFDRSVRLYRMALDRGEWAPEPTRRLRQALGTALANAGRGAESSRELLAAAEGATAGEALRLRQRAAEELLRSGHVDEGLKMASEVLRASGIIVPETPRRALIGIALRRAILRVRGLGFTTRDESQIAPKDLMRLDACWSAAGFVGLVDAIRGSYFQAHHLLLALKIGEPYRIVRALAWESVYHASFGSRGEARALAVLNIARPLAATTRGPYGADATTAWLIGVAAVIAYMSGRWRKCVDHSAEVEQIYRERGWPSTFRELRNVQLFAMTALAFLGELSKLRRGVLGELREAEECGNLMMATDMRTGAQTLAWLVADEVDEASRQLDTAARQWSHEGFHVQHFRQLVSRTHLDLYLGDGAAAHHRIVTTWPALSRSMLLRVQQARIYAFDLRARTAIAAAVHDLAHQRALLSAAEADGRRIGREGAAWAKPTAALIHGLSASVRGDRPRATQMLREAVNGFDSVGMALYAAAARRRLADLVDQGESHSLLEQWRTYMQTQGVVNAERMTGLIAPESARPRLLG